MSDVELDFQSDKPYSTKGILLIFSGNDDEPLYSDTFDIANDKKRTEFIDKVVQVCEGIPSEKLEQSILFGTLISSGSMPVF